MTTGHCGMEMSMLNMIEPGDRVLIAQNGIWGQRAAHFAKLINADVHVMQRTVGTAFTLEQFEEVHIVACFTSTLMIIRLCPVLNHTYYLCAMASHPLVFFSH
jgi:hypothetical protein